MKVPGVYGVGSYTSDADDGAVAIRIIVSKVTPEIEAIPPVLGGFVVVFDMVPRSVQVKLLANGKSFPRR